MLFTQLAEKCCMAGIHMVCHCLYAHTLQITDTAVLHALMAKIKNTWPYPNINYLIKLRIETFILQPPLKKKIFHAWLG